MGINAKRPTLGGSRDMNISDSGTASVDPNEGSDIGLSDDRTAAMDELGSFADQLMAIAQRLRDGAENTPPAAKQAPAASSTVQARSRYAELARRTYAVRRQRTAIFGDPELFGEPAWDILLDLYIAFVERKPVSVSSACIGSAAPPTTGLRWLGVLAEHGLVVREQDPTDQRRVLVRLTEWGVEAMERYFAKVDAS